MALYLAERTKERIRRVPLLRPLLGFWWRCSMIRSRRLPREWVDGSVDGFLPEDLIDVVLAFHAENPDRVGCPPPPILRELASRTRPIDDPWWRHLQTCSNCYRHVRASQHLRWPWVGPSSRHTIR
jgi:hypothetical protein